jgi:amino acid transporter
LFFVISQAIFWIGIIDEKSTFAYYDSSWGLFFTAFTYTLFLFTHFKEAYDKRRRNSFSVIAATAMESPSMEYKEIMRISSREKTLWKWTVFMYC